MSLSVWLGSAGEGVSTGRCGAASPCASVCLAAVSLCGCREGRAASGLQPCSAARRASCRQGSWCLTGNYQALMEGP